MEDFSYYRKEWQGVDCGTNYELLVQALSQDKLEEKSKPVFISQRSMRNFRVIYFLFQRQIMQKYKKTTVESIINTSFKE